ETRGADDAFDAVCDAGLQMGEGAFGAGEVDQAVGGSQCVQIVGDPHAGVHTQECPGILADGVGPRTVQCDGQGEILGFDDGLDQHVSHAARGACDGNAHYGCSSWASRAVSSGWMDDLPLSARWKG